MLRVRFLHRNFKNSFQVFSRTLLSNEFKNAMNTRLPPPAIDENQLSLLGSNVKTGLSAVEIDLYVNRISSNDDRRIEICDQLIKLRLGDTAKVLDSTNYAVIRHFIESGHTHELLPILSNRLDYGIFLDNFSGCYLLDHLLSTGDHVTAAQIAVELMLQENLEHRLLIALAIKSCYGCLQSYVTDPAIASALKPQPPAPVDPKSEKKVRVKFLRNASDNGRRNDKPHMIGKTIMHMIGKCPKDIQYNMKIIGLILCEQYKEIIDLLKVGGEPGSSDVFQLALSLLKGRADVPEELLNYISSNLSESSNNNFDKKLNAYVKETLQKEEQLLITQQKEMHAKWTSQRDDILRDEIERKTRVLRHENAKNILEEIDVKKQKLWFFELEDKLDLDIYRKKVYYPKKWFGKKKKPRVIDDDYVPPEITRKA